MTVTIRNTTPTPTPTPTAVDLMKTQFLDWVGTCSETNHLSSKPHNSFRLATYNIHYFTDIYEQVSKFDEIMNDIDVMNVDCIGLQEILIGGEQVAINKNLSIDVSHFLLNRNPSGFTNTSFVIVCLLGTTAFMVMRCLFGILTVPINNARARIWTRKYIHMIKQRLRLLYQVVCKGHPKHDATYIVHFRSRLRMVPVMTYTFTIHI